MWNGTNFKDVYHVKNKSWVEQTICKKYFEFISYFGEYVHLIPIMIIYRTIYMLHYCAHYNWSQPPLKDADFFFLYHFWAKVSSKKRLKIIQYMCYIAARIVFKKFNELKIRFANGLFDHYLFIIWKSSMKIVSFRI